jgi:Neprosin
MSASLHSSRHRFRLTAVAAAAILAIAVPAATASAASSHAAAPAKNNTAIRCTKEPAKQPPPLGILKAIPVKYGGSRKLIPAPAPVATPQLKPVCPPGMVPVLKDLFASNGNPDLGRRVSSTLNSPSLNSSLIEQPCGGVVEDGGCYFWSYASDSRTAQGGGVTMTIENPTVASTLVTQAGHSLEEMSVQAGANEDNIVEIGSTVWSDEGEPWLFVFHWVNGKPTCYYACGFQSTNSTYYPGMSLASMVGDSVYNGYVFWQGSWWAWFNDQWLGYFPASIWGDQFEQSTQVQWFGEVDATAGIPPQSQMGDGLFASNTAAAPMSTMCDVDYAAWRCYYYNQQTLSQTDANFYTIQDTTFGADRLGGPGT